MTSPTESSSRSTSAWRRNLGLSALLVLLGAAVIGTADPRDFAQAGFTGFGLLIVGAPYLLVIVLVALGKVRAAAWTGAALAGLFLLGGIVLIGVLGEDAFGIVLVLSGIAGIPLVLAVVAHGTMLVSALSLLRGSTAGGSPLAFFLMAGVLTSVILFGLNVLRYLGSPQRAQSVGIGVAHRADAAMQELTHCLGLYQRQNGRYPDGLAAIGPDGTRCAPRNAVDNGIQGYDVRYARTAEGYDLRFLLKDRTRPPYGHWRSDETGTLFHSSESDGGAGTAYDVSLSILQNIDLCVEQYRLAHPDEGYPSSLAAAQEKIGCFGPLFGQIDEQGRSILELRRFNGHRYLYVPSGAAAGDRKAGFRLDVRPVAYGRPFKKSYLCTPEGTLHVTEEDRAAEKTDTDMQLDPFSLQLRPGSNYCIGPRTPALRRSWWAL